MLRARLFGKPAFFYEQQALTLQGKAALLLAYLVSQAQQVSRHDLLTLFWPDGKAHNLRQGLATLRKLPGAAHWLEDDGREVRVQAQTDVQDFLRLAGSQPAEALALAAHPFMDLDVGSRLEPWRDEQRQYLREAVQQARRTHAAQCVEQSNWAQAQRLLEALLHDDPLDEDAVERLIALHLQRGQRPAASTVYETFRRELLPLGTQPQPRISALLGRERDYPQLLAQARTLLPEALKPGSAALWSRVVGVPELEVAQWMASSVPDVPPPAAPLAALWHGRLARALLELDERPAALPRHSYLHLIAAHWEQAASPRDAVAIYSLAAQDAERAGANEDALHAVQHALRLAEDETQEELLRRQAGLLEALGRTEELLTLAAQQAAFARRWQSDLALLGSHLSYSTALMRRGELEAASTHLHEAHEVLRRMDRVNVAVPPALRGRLHGLDGALHLRSGRLEQAERAFHAGLAFEVPPELRLRLLANLGSVYGLRGQLQESLQTLEDCLSVARDGRDLNVLAGVLVNLGTTAERSGLPDRARAAYQEGVALASRLGLTPTLQAAYRNLAALHLRCGRLGYAWNTARELEDDPALPADQRLLSHLTLAEIEWLCGDTSAAAQRLHGLSGLPWTPNERHHFLLRGYRAVLQTLTRSGSVSALPFLQEARAAGHTDLIWDIGLDVATFQTDPRQQQQVLDWLGTPPAENLDAQRRHQLAGLLLDWRSGRPVDRAALTQVCGQDFLHVTLAARLLHQIGPSALTQQRLDTVAQQQAEALPSPLRERFLAQARTPLF